MNPLSQLLKLIATIGFFLIHAESQAMLVATSCLKRTRLFAKNRLVILYDKHALSPNDPIKKGHINDMSKLIHTLKNSKNNVPFLIEICEAHKESERLNNMIESPSNVVIKLALKNELKYGNINFIPFDNRNNYDIWIRDMLFQTEQFAHAIKQNYQFPNYFYNITAEFFLEHLNFRYNSTVESIENLPVSQTIKKQYYHANKKKLADCYTILNHLLKSYNVNNKQHLFNLIRQLNASEKTPLFLTLMEEQNGALDMNLLNEVLKQSEKHSLSILLAGAYHSNTVEKFLLSQCSDFEKDLSSSMILPDLKVDNLSHIQWPRHVPDNFINKDMENFIQIDYVKE